MFVVHKLTEDVKLLPQELVGEIHLKKQERRCATGETNKTSETSISEGDPLKHTVLPFPSTHRGVHNACAVGPDGVGDVTDVDSVQVLVVTCLLYEDLLESKNCI